MTQKIRLFRTFLSHSFFFFFTIGLTLYSSVALGATIYVPDDYETIQAGMDAAVPGDTVMVRDGTYLLSNALDFKGKAITVTSEHGPASCFLDGQSTTRVVYFHTSEGSNSVLSGFTIQNGQATSGGAGIHCDASSPSIINCAIIRNNVYTTKWWGSAFGAGIYCKASSAKIINCTISSNSVIPNGCNYSYGGGIYINGGSPIIIGCNISGNTAISASDCAGNSYGGGVYSESSSPSFANCTINNNSVSSGYDSYGGGVYFTGSTPSFVNCIINGNTADLGAGIYFFNSGNFASFTNCTIVRNTAQKDGGGMYCDNTSPQIINSILWQDSPTEIFTSSENSNPTITYSDVLGGYSGTGNIDTDPLFVGIATQDFHLKPASSCINTGNNAAPELPSKDYDGNPRIIDGTVDMGAYEAAKIKINAFVADPIAGAPPLKVTFACDATAGNGSIVQYEWDFGDGSDRTTTEHTTTYTYAAVGTYEASVTVTDSSGQKITSRKGQIQVSNGPDITGKIQEYNFHNSGNDVHMQFLVSNVGNKPSGQFIVRFFFSNDGAKPITPAFKQIILKYGLSEGASQLISIDETFTESIYGKHILIYTDATRKVAEANELNNNTDIVIQEIKKRWP